VEYLTREDDTVDLICYRIYGHHENGIADKVIRANIKILTARYEKTPGFRGKLPAGLSLTLPDRPKASKIKKIRRLF